jgi:hypothetical protein
MRVISKLLASSAVAAGVMLASAAHAVTIISMSPGVLQLPAPASAVIPKGTFAQGTGTWDFTFTTLGGAYKALMQAQASKAKNGVPQSLSFALYSGTPLGANSFIANSGGTATAATLLTNLSPGSYFLQLTTFKAPKELVTGGVTLLSAVPEPATWAVMLIGIGGIGAMSRTRRRAVATAAAA